MSDCSVRNNIQLILCFSFFLYFLNLFILIMSSFCSFLLILVYFFHVVLHYYVPLRAFSSSSFTHSFLFLSFLLVFHFNVSFLSLVILYGSISFQFLCIIFHSVPFLFPSPVFPLLFPHSRWATTVRVV